MADAFTLSPFELFVLPTRTRFPFRYGIASMTDVPHLFVRVRVNSGSKSSYGLAAEGLPPKWFTKDPSTTFDQDLPIMLDVVRHAVSVASSVAAAPISFFALWQELNERHSAWAASAGIAPLLAHLGVSLVERAVLDGLCRVAREPLHRMVAANRLGLVLGDVYGELAGLQPHELLPAAPLSTCHVRHTIGLGDPLAPADIPAGERVDDGLPQDLESSVRVYGLRYFKVKLSGTLERDVPRLGDLGRLLERETKGDYHVTLDGNESFREMAAFRAYWEALAADPSFQPVSHRLLVVEQPVHRDQALDGETGRQLLAWADGPRMIIDESDGAVGDVPRALEIGYVGASFKSCKGIVKGLANACLLSRRRSQGRPGVLTGEDLCTIGPVTLLQDLAMTAILGIEHVERNGHHYHRGLSAFPGEWQKLMASAHDDLYAMHPSGFAHLRIEEGRLALGSVNSSPAGVAPLFDPSMFAAVSDDDGVRWSRT